MRDGEILILSAARRRRADRARQVADLVRHQIATGAYIDGSLPAESSLVSEYGVSRNTVRAALDLLRAEGLLTRCPRVGTVAQPKVTHDLRRLLGLGEALHAHGDVVNRLRVADIVKPPNAVARRLSLDEPAWVAYIERVRELDGKPLSLDLTYLPADIGELILREDLEGTDIFVLLEQVTGQRLGGAELSFEAVNADPASAALLDAEPGSAVLMVERLTRLADGRPVDFESVRFRGDRLTMRAMLARDDASCPPVLPARFGA